MDVTVIYVGGEVTFDESQKTFVPPLLAQEPVNGFTGVEIKSVSGTSLVVCKDFIAIGLWNGVNVKVARDSVLSVYAEGVDITDMYGYV